MWDHQPRSHGLASCEEATILGIPELGEAALLPLLQFPGLGAQSEAAPDQMGSCSSSSESTCRVPAGLVGSGRGNRRLVHSLCTSLASRTELPVGETNRRSAFKECFQLSLGLPGPPRAPARLSHSAQHPNRTQPAPV